MREKYLKFIEEYLKEIRIFDLMNKRLIIFLKNQQMSEEEVAFDDWEA
jgi:hypothetical protein